MTKTINGYFKVGRNLKQRRVRNNRSGGETLIGQVKSETTAVAIASAGETRDARFLQGRNNLLDERHGSGSRSVFVQPLAQVEVSRFQRIFRGRVSMQVINNDGFEPIAREVVRQQLVIVRMSDTTE